MQLVHGGGIGRLPREHARLLRRQIALAQVTGRAGSDDVFPGGLAALASGNDVIEGEVFRRGAVLTVEAVAEEDVEAGEGGVGGRLDEGLERNDAGQSDLEAGTSYRTVVVLDD